MDQSAVSLFKTRVCVCVCVCVCVSSAFLFFFFKVALIYSVLMLLLILLEDAVTSQELLGCMKIVLLLHVSLV